MLSRISGEIDGLLGHPISGLYQHKQLDSLDAWRHQYHTHGLNFARAAGDAPVLRELVTAGVLENVGGKTKASGWKLTWRGIIATQPDGGAGRQGILYDLGVLCAMKPDQLNGGYEAICGYRLAPAAAASKKHYDPDRHRHELASVRIALTPLLAMGWATLSFDGTGAVWAVKITDAGRSAWQDLPVADQELFDFDSWQRGYDYADQYARRGPPAGTDNLVPWRLSTGAAWRDQSKTSIKELYAELNGFAGIKE